RMLRSIVCIVLITAASMAAQAQSSDCNAPAASPSLTVSLPASPFMVAPSKDGCWVFVSLTGRGDNMGIAVLKRSGGKIVLGRVAPLPAPRTVIRMTHAEKLLTAAPTSAAIFGNTKRPTAGDADPVGGRLGAGRGAISPNPPADDKLLFVSEEN